MSWGMRHQALIIAGIVIVLVFIAALIIIPTVYHAPSCSDGKQNQKEDGVDCGGPCTYLCTAQLSDPNPPRFARAIVSGPQAVDVISYIDNPNGSAAARAAEYTVELLDSSGATIASKVGTVDLPPAATAPIFIGGIYTGTRTVTQVFLSIATTSLHWFTYRDNRVVLSVHTIRLDTSSGIPRVFATLENPSADVLTNVKVIATVFDVSKNVIATSQTVLPMIPPQGTTDAVFTWNVPFATTPGRIDVLPVLPLPRP